MMFFQNTIKRFTSSKPFLNKGEKIKNRLVKDRINDLYHKDKILKKEIKSLKKADENLNEANMLERSLSHQKIRPRTVGHKRRASEYHNRKHKKGMPMR